MSDKPKKKGYDPKESEPKWQEFWENEELFKFDPQKGGEVFSIDTPPPTVSGRMHMGHAFSYTQGDFVARYKRMRGFNVFYPFGTDDNGLPTDRLVEKTKKIRSTQFARPEYVKICLDFVKENNKPFIKDWKNLGISAWTQDSYSTINDHCQKTCQKSFLELYKKGRVFQEESPISWCTTCQTAIAQAEFENVDMTSHFNDIIFKSGGRDLVIATTRPELLPACVALFVHPEDDRYKELVGKHATVPLFGYEVPILADEHADPEKGTGIVMCCTFGDKTDVEWWRLHKLPLKVVINKNGRMNSEAQKYEGLSSKEARKAIIEDLKKEELLVAQKDITHPVNVHERCGTDLEYLKTKQWYIKVLDKKQELLEAGDKIKWYPNFMKVRYKHWVENLNWDWCISRQRHYGVPIPVWYCKKCGAVKLPDEAELPVDPTVDSPKGKCECGSEEFIGETDTFDTWMTSSMTPQIVCNWAEDREGSNKKIPMSIRLQAHDIIRTWAFYTITKALFHDEKIPWKDIMISGHAQDPRGKKMSKSKGNVVDPNLMREKYCADALRFWAAGSKLGDDLPFMEKDLLTGKKMITKMYNATNFVMMHLEDYDGVFDIANLMQIDKWILSKLNRMIKACTESFDKYEYSRTKAEVEKFFWNDFCDNYLEIVKDRLYNPDKYGKAARKSAQYTLNHCLLACLKMMAPIMPHITEEIYQQHFKEQDGCVSVHLSKWPESNEKLVDEKAEEIGDIAVSVICGVRKYKSEQNVSLGLPVKLLTIKCNEHTKEKLEMVFDAIEGAARAEKIEFGDDADTNCEGCDALIGVVLGEKKK